MVRGVVTVNDAKSERIETSAYIIIQPERRGYDGQVVGISIDRIVKSKPQRLGVRDIAIKVNLVVDSRLFSVPAPEVTIELQDQRSIITPSMEIDTPDEEPEPVEA